MKAEKELNQWLRRVSKLSISENYADFQWLAHTEIAELNRILQRAEKEHQGYE